jgi:hypothetical protein
LHKEKNNGGFKVVCNLLLLPPHKLALTNHKTQHLLKMLIWETEKLIRKIEKDSTKPLKGQCFKVKFIS